MTTEDVVSKFVNRHGDRYNYSCVEYKSYYEKVKIGCAVHGYFYQAAHHHYDGKGCPSCAKSGSKLNRERVISDFNNVHGDEFIYDKFKYRNDYTKSIVTCREHGDFHITPNSHKNGTKCPYCFMERSGFGKSNFVKCSLNFNGIASLYLIKLTGNNECFYKVGITTDFKKRFVRSKIPYEIDVIRVLSGEAGIIWEIEKEIHRKLFNFRYKPSLSFNGSTECFDIRSIDKTTRMMSLIDKEIAAGKRLN